MAPDRPRRAASAFVIALSGAEFLASAGAHLSAEGQICLLTVIKLVVLAQAPANALVVAPAAPAADQLREPTAFSWTGRGGRFGQHKFVCLFLCPHALTSCAWAMKNERKFVRRRPHKPAAHLRALLTLVGPHLSHSSGLAVVVPPPADGAVELVALTLAGLTVVVATAAASQYGAWRTSSGQRRAASMQSVAIDRRTWLRLAGDILRAQRAAPSPLSPRPPRQFSKLRPGDHTLCRH